MVSVLECFIAKTMPFSCYSDEKASFNIIGIPLENSVTYRPGTRFAPRSIREASCNIEFYSIYNDRDVEDLLFNDIGDIIVVPGDNTKSLQRIERVSRELLELYPNKIPIYIGGEHTLTYATTKPYNDVGVIVFDAHADLRSEYQGYSFGHASVLRRIVERYDSDWKPLIVGVRALSKEEVEFIKSVNIPVVKTKDILFDMRKALRMIDEYTSTYNRIYLSIDMDVFDPAYAPGVSNPEPIGISPLDLLRIVGEIVSRSSIVGIDIVEVNPISDVNDVTSLLAAKIIVEIASMIQFK